MHTCESNIFFLDSPVNIINYAERAVELGHKILSTCEHGFQGDFLNKWLVAKSFGLKYLFAVEAYWVKDRISEYDNGNGKTKDRTNAHIVLIAKDETGRRQITRALTQANDDGFYYRPRLDLDLLMSLDPNHVIITTACIAFWDYGFPETEQIILQLWRRFKDSFYLEVQAHHIDKQKEINRFILGLYRKYGIQIIAACDSHYILPKQAEDRKNLQNSTEASFETDYEDNLYMDYPDGDELFKRFQEQGVLPEAIINEAINNTNIFLTLPDITFDKNKKIPNPYPMLSKEERNQKYLELVYDAWNTYKKTRPQTEWEHYEREIKYEVDTIIDTDFADYFLLDYEIVKRGIAKGGIVSRSGRGSGPSYFTNTLLGFSTMDRLNLPVTMFPDRFVSRPRLLAGKLPDLDLNVAERQPFVDAQKELIGDEHAFPMIAYSALKRKAAWKMYARAKGVDPQLANTISEQLGRYDLAVKYKDDDEEIDIADYVDEEFLALVEKSKEYTGIIAGKTIHPCAILIYDGDIKSEIGLVRAKSKSGKVDELVTVIDGDSAGAFGYLKNDILRVAVWELISEVYNNIGIPIPDTNELLTMVDNDRDTWNVFAKGYTIGVNQCERAKTNAKLMRYKPKNLTELSAFVAGVRPSFKSSIETFLSRTPFSYGIPEFDNIIQTKYMKSSFILYQENIMAALKFAGFPQEECYIQLQNISKKHPDEIAKIKPRFIEGFSKQCIDETPEKANELASKVWEIIFDAAGYGFNASHSTAVAFDALYIAYAKAHYPLKTYTSMLKVYSKRGDKDRLSLIKNEMANGYKIHMKPAEFGTDNTDFFADEGTQTIRDALHSMPYMSRLMAKVLYSISSEGYNNWIDLLVRFEYERAINSRQIRYLIMMDYFKQFGPVGKLLDVFDEFKDGETKYAKTYCDVTKEKRLAALKKYNESLVYEDTSPYVIAKNQVEITGSPIGVFDVDAHDYIITDIDVRRGVKVYLYSLRRGTTGVLKFKKEKYQHGGFQKGDCVKILEWKDLPKMIYSNGESKKSMTETERWIESMVKIA